jgi:death-on-curing protein
VASWRYLTSDELVQLGQKHSVGPVVDRGKLDACVAAPAATFDGCDLYPEIADKAAAICFAIVKSYHPFLDGNKRAAAIAMLMTCYINGFVPMITQSELVALIVLVAKGDATREDLAEFLRDRMT